jgi:hypothetical protein
MPQAGARVRRLWKRGEFMSGPIVRKYGFPNFDKIFGERPLQHGLDESEQAADQPGAASTKKPQKKAAPKTKTPKPKKS